MQCINPSPGILQHDWSNTPSKTPRVSHILLDRWLLDINTVQRQNVTRYCCTKPYQQHTISVQLHTADKEKHFKPASEPSCMPSHHQATRETPTPHVTHVTVTWPGHTFLAPLLTHTAPPPHTLAPQSAAALQTPTDRCTHPS